MFSRLQDYRARRKKRLDKARAEAKAKAKAEVYQEFAAWNTRRLAAEARNEPFTEPFPELPNPKDI